ncbi:putative vacuolar protein sorting-associated protein 26C [Monocercomonoides exilis]|uniref:putative vacuolar protein sorting-associated protein 26C n=1 Tax=Monocercomonoides exilis TaxID=2049356 RepID=UPI00355A7D06|nr:putative vacuolar protein sorting-associated protein 26C [Monocercomonoides exilis]|eukprot:MONOS_12072.1-p1 / transcript=MONOS_12072.1 / gene=MONOS_12072 / organism=Monocercomonoides_exilis_PA203 / gene_product=Down syndrome critical region protein 3-like protein / transcript_product=Down syndrome critical region protein 3-like protein / location=Mono_scaffold00643:2205-3392(-) / protein_length=303 / sequence_SO=supercontig / SO=protein_coding / is_pseudo=false
MEPSLAISLKRPDKTYTPGRPVNGLIRVDSPTQALTHQGIKLVFEGSLTLTHGLDSAAFSSQEKHQLARIAVDISQAGKLPKGITEIPFEFPLEMKEGFHYFETYHGILVNVRYTLTCEIPRGMFSKTLKKTVEVVIVDYSHEAHPPKPLEFEMTSEKLKKASDKSDSEAPSFHFRGRVNTRLCNVVEPFMGEIEIVNSTLPIRSVELQLVRAESVVSSKHFEVTEIQNIQIADGDILHGTKLPIHMVLPRLFVSSTMKSPLFAVEFEVNVVVLFQDQSLVSENVPVVFYRTKPDRGTVWTDP